MQKITTSLLNTNIEGKKLDIFHMTRCNAAFTNCNAKAYYDHVIPEIAALKQFQAGLLDHTATFFL
eukprot:399667-Ditylum_brightwellii.AAC.1